MNQEPQIRRFGPWLLFLTVLFGLTLGIARAAHRQASSAPEPRHSMGQELVKETREAAGEDSAEQFKHSSSVRFISRITGLDLEHSYWLAMATNFIVVAAIILWIGKKTFPAMFRNRTALIQKSMAEAQRASADANRRLAEIESRLSKLDVELGEMRNQADKEAAAEEKRIEAAAKEDAAKVLASVEQEVTAAVRSARRELKAYAADLAVSLAQKQIHVDAATDQTLVNEFARQLSDGQDGRRSQ
jgi:F-type H+-transporting ATPase subunit b